MSFALLVGNAHGQPLSGLVPQIVDPELLPQGTPFLIQNADDPTLCWAVSATIATFNVDNGYECKGILAQPCTASARSTFLWRSQTDPRWASFPTVYSAGGFGFLAAFLSVTVPRVTPCATGALLFAAEPNGGSPVQWTNGGPMRSLDWDPTLCVELGAGSWLWWAPCDGTGRQRWRAYFPGAPLPLPPPSRPPPPRPPSPPPPPPAQQLPAALPSSSSSVTVASLAEFRLAALNLTKTEFIVTSPLLVIDGTPLNITRPGARVRIVGPPCALWSGSCPRLSGGNLSSVLLAVGATVEIENLEIVDGVSAQSGGAVVATGTTVIRFNNVGFSHCESALVRFALLCASHPHADGCLRSFRPNQPYSKLLLAILPPSPRAARGLPLRHHSKARNVLEHIRSHLRRPARRCNFLEAPRFWGANGGFVPRLHLRPERLGVPDGWGGVLVEFECDLRRVQIQWLQEQPGAQRRPKPTVSLRSPPAATRQGEMFRSC